MTAVLDSEAKSSAGFGPRETMEYSREIPIKGHYDVIVCGGGPSGVPSALAAGRRGCRVLLVESSGQLGGAGVSAGVSHLLGGRAPDNSRWSVGGIFREVAEDLAATGGAIHPRDIKSEKYSPHGWNGVYSVLTYGVPFDPIAMASLLDQKMLDAGVDVLFFTHFVDVDVNENRIQRVITFNKSGLEAYSANAVVDATGDGDVASRAGCDYVKGRPEDGLMTPATLMFHVDRVDQDVLASEIYRSNSPRFRELIQQLRSEGRWPFAYDIFISVQLQEKGTLMINTTRICDVDGTDGRSLSRGMMQGRSEVIQLFDIMRNHFPGFANARIKFVAPVLGVRETRRIQGDFIYRVEDVVEARDFDDTIGWSSYAWDLPDPKRPSHQALHEQKMGMKRPYTPLPYRVMVPKPIENLICPGRAISVEREVLGPLREQGPCYAMGEAAGVAASRVARRLLAFSEVDTAELRTELEQQGAIVQYPGT